MTTRGLDPRRWPITIRVPAAVAALVLLICFFVAAVVVTRFASAQERNLDDLLGTYLDGVAESVLPHVLAGDVWGTFDALDRSPLLRTGAGRPLLIVADHSGEVVASNDPRRYRTGSPTTASGDVPTAWPTGPSIAFAGMHALARRGLAYQGRDVGSVLAAVDVSSAYRQRRRVVAAAFAAIAAIAIASALAAYAVVRGMLAPVRVLASHLGAGVAGPVTPIPDDLVTAQGPEFRAAFTRYNAMVGAVGDREALATRLADEERAASLGRLASGLAHEINNPLGGLFAALDTLRRHEGDVEARRRSLDLLDRGLGHLRDVVRAVLVAHRPPEPAACLASAELDDLRLLVEPEATRRDAVIVWTNEVSGLLAVPAAKLKQAVLNLLINAARATPAGGVIRFHAAVLPSGLVVEVSDGGPGMPPAYARFLSSPAAPGDRPFGPGLGLWIVRRLVAEAGGTVTVARSADALTTVRTVWPLAGRPA